MMAINETCMFCSVKQVMNRSQYAGLPNLGQTANDQVQDFLSPRSRKTRLLVTGMNSPNIWILNAMYE
jgi:hypothetical protein